MCGSPYRSNIVHNLLRLVTDQPAGAARQEDQCIKTRVSKDYFRMFWMYAQNNGDARLAIEDFKRRYPGQRIPSHNTLRRVVYRFYTTGSVMAQGSEMGRPRSARRVSTNAHVLEAVQEDATVNVRDLSRHLNISRTTVNRILKEHMLHPCKYVLKKKSDRKIYTLVCSLFLKIP
ncbi:uncharacterized protein LOC128896665 isoform X1 [Hylaeus anthracinus]|uniref:uncharacterized protein LOC128896665 isoform X1 n=2 Tax=Hylaeus anthracinus TaxID=313031 RepID=UPI0023B8CD38|nr:uncharacterized protein LOC128896665 isoform X1 [Hylaeus anthracinus]